MMTFRRCVLALSLAAARASAQTAHDTATKIRDVEVTVTRDAARSPLELPFAITRVQPDSARPGLRHLSLDETLQLVPGVLTQTRSNPAQDPRISIRGFGARSAFGVRGVRILRDGIPLTLPDGQTPVDYLDLESVGSVEVIRGSASALYGNAAGGVVDLRTAEPPAVPFAARVTGWGGADEARRWAGAAGGTAGRLRWQGDLARSTTDGVRQYSRQRTTSGFARVATTVRGTDVALEGMGFSMPVAESPGALTAALLAANPDTADPFSVRKRARKAVTQSQVGLVLSRRGPGGELTATAYGGTRSLDNPLTPNVVGIRRRSGGASVRGSLPFSLGTTPLRLTGGVDLQRLHDDRQNFANCNPPTAATQSCPVVGRERGVTTLDQTEVVSSLGPFVRAELEPAARLRLAAGARADYVRFRLDDHLLTDGRDDSGVRTLHAVSPTAGAVLRVGLLHALYANVASAFETPTTTELTNKPDGSAGFNPDLRPQYSTTYEAGLKGVLLARLRYDVAAFATGVRDELVPYEVPGGSGRRYFRNAGRTRRRGAEASLDAALGAVELGATYAYSRFRFVDYAVTAGGVTTDFAGKQIPGVPRQLLQGYATWRVRGWWLAAEGVAAGRIFADDGNTASAAGYRVLNLRAGGTLGALGGAGVGVAPVVAVQNVFDRRYVPSVSVNAAGGKFYEPAPGRTVFVGLTVGAGR